MLRGSYLNELKTRVSAEHLATIRPAFESMVEASRRWDDPRIVTRVEVSFEPDGRSYSVHVHSLVPNQAGPSSA